MTSSSCKILAATLVFRSVSSFRLRMGALRLRWVAGTARTAPALPPPPTATLRCRRRCRAENSEVASPSGTSRTWRLPDCHPSPPSGALVRCDAILLDYLSQHNKRRDYSSSPRISLSSHRCRNEQLALHSGRGCNSSGKRTFAAFVPLKAVRTSEIQVRAACNAAGHRGRVAVGAAAARRVSLCLRHGSPEAHPCRKTEGPDHIENKRAANLHDCRCQWLN